MLISPDRWVHHFVCIDADYIIIQNCVRKFPIYLNIQGICGYLGAVVEIMVISEIWVLEAQPQREEGKTVNFRTTTKNKPKSHRLRMRGEREAKHNWCRSYFTSLCGCIVTQLFLPLQETSYYIGWLSIFTWHGSLYKDWNNCELTRDPTTLWEGLQDLKYIEIYGLILSHRDLYVTKFLVVAL